MDPGDERKEGSEMTNAQDIIDAGRQAHIAVRALVSGFDARWGLGAGESEAYEAEYAQLDAERDRLEALVRAGKRAEAAAIAEVVGRMNEIVGSDGASTRVLIDEETDSSATYATIRDGGDSQLDAWSAAGRLDEYRTLRLQAHSRCESFSGAFGSDR